MKLSITIFLVIPITVYSGVCEIPLQNDLNICKHVDYVAYRNDDTKFGQLDNDVRTFLMTTDEDFFITSHGFDGEKEYNDLLVRRACAFYFLKCYRNDEPLPSLQNNV